jgi:hypothetical protein
MWTKWATCIRRSHSNLMDGNVKKIMKKMKNYAPEGIE